MHKRPIRQQGNDNIMSESVSKIARPDVATGKIVCLDAFSGGQVFDEKTFLRMLYLERKRAERSSRRFVLMLLETESLLKAGHNPAFLQRIVQALANSIRETDIKGWYEDGSIIGIIFTEIGDADENT